MPPKPKTPKAIKRKSIDDDDGVYEKNNVEEFVPMEEVKIEVDTLKSEVSDSHPQYPHPLFLLIYLFHA